MKILLVHPGASWSVQDVWRGVYDALTRTDNEIVQYALDGRIQYAGGYLAWVDKRNKGATKHGDADVLYLACVGIIERALRHEVDWVLIIAGTYIHPQALMLMKRAGLKIAVILTESPYADAQEIITAQVADVVFTNERISIDTFTPYCKRVHYWQHAMDPARHHPDVQDADAEGMEDIPQHDVVFVGTGFEERIEMLQAVNWQGIDFGLYGAWGLCGSRNPLRKHLRANIIDNRLTAALYRKARIGLNIHRTSIGFGRNVAHLARAESMNPRCYELAACGRFFLTDPRAEVTDVFGDVVPTFSTAQELEELIRFYLAHESERLAIAKQLPALIAPHTFDARIKDVLRILEEK